jgi:hypothetical protein
MPIVLSYSEVGGHRVNEDAFAVQAHPSDGDCWLCCLADGQGGQAGGGPAAQVACRTAMTAASQLPVDQLASATMWPDLLRLADEAVAMDRKAGYTTLVGFSVVNGQLRGASSGDSAVLAVVKAQQVHELTANQVKNPPVGSGAAVFTPFGLRLQHPWMVLAMSDGVWKYAGWERVGAIALRERGQALLDELQKATRLPASGKFQDDFTVVMLEDRELSA